MSRNSWNTEGTDLANICARDILHVHCARRGRASTLRLCTLIVVVTGNMPTNFQEDWIKNKVTVIAKVQYFLVARETLHVDYGRSFSDSLT